MRFNSKFYQAAFDSFAETCLSFFSICLSKKKKKCKGILKKYVFKNKIFFCLKKERIVSLNKKVIYVFHTIFKLDFITQIIYCIIHRCLYSLFILFCSLISVSKKRNIETMLTIPYSNHCQKFNNKMNEKGRQEYRSMDPEYVTGPINSRILKLLWR